MTSSARSTAPAGDMLRDSAIARLSRWGRYALEAILDLIFPPRCAGCGKVGDYFCRDCRHLVRKPNLADRTYPLCVVSAGIFEEPLRSAVHALKYRKQRPLAEILADLMIANGLDWEPDLIIPVPLHPSRLRERGFNQAELLAQHIGAATNVTVNSQALSRVRETRSQVGLSWRERQDNVKDAFEAKPELVIGKRVLLIDDVITTGATLGACANALLKAGAAEVRAMTLAAAPGYEAPPSE